MHQTLLWWWHLLFILKNLEYHINHAYTWGTETWLSIYPVWVTWNLPPDMCSNYWNHSGTSELQSLQFYTFSVALDWHQQPLDILCMNIIIYPMLRADSRFWLVNNREIWSRISRLTSSAWDIKTKERHWWRHNGDSDRRPLSLPLRYDLVTLCLYDDLGQINVIAGILKLRKRFRMSQIMFEHGINSLPLVCWRGYGNLSTLSIAILRLAFGRAWYCDAACG